MFTRVYLINLKRRADRLANFRHLQKSNGWELPEPIIFEAIEGDKVGVPPYFTQGGGAFGCLRSHCSILERCVMDEVGSVLVLEDDLTWMSDCWERLIKFMKEVPNDWNQLMLGGQHIKQAVPMSGGGVCRVLNTQRTHAYAVRGPAIKSLLNTWSMCSVHIDWVMGGDWQKGQRVYCPEPFVFGQAGGKSDISGRLNPAYYWNSPDKAPVIVLDAPLAVVEKLRGYGFHCGYNRRDGLDVGLIEVANAKFKSVALRKWLDTLLWEVASMEGHVCTVYHPDISAEDVKRVHQGDVIAVKGDTVEECLKQVEHLKLKKNCSATHVLVLRASRQVVENLGGFHRGYWLDKVTGMDNGQREAAVAQDRVAKLTAWLAAVSEECERQGAVPMIWHPDITADDMKAAAPDRHVVEIEAGSVDEVLTKWRNFV